MKCPECHQPLEKKQVGDTAIDECRRCRGIWFDPGEIDGIKDDIDPDLRWMDLEFWRQKADFQVAQDPLFCPRCRNVAIHAFCETDTDICVRFCARCGGNWLKAADFREIIAVLDKELERRTTADYLKLSLKQAVGLLSAEDGFVSEWKDLKAVLRLLKYRVFIENPKLQTIMKGLQKTLPL
jgi:Zn-finger nucleic acid-binding protein